MLYAEANEAIDALDEYLLAWRQHEKSADPTSGLDPVLTLESKRHARAKLLKVLTRSPLIK